jgi:type I restriction enzyme S subunit
MKWQPVAFKNFIQLQRGFDLPKSSMQEGEVPVLGSNCIIGYHNEAKAAPPGVVTGRSGTLGHVQYTDSPYWPHNTALWVKDFKGNHPKFVFYKLQTLNLDTFNSGVSVPTLNRNALNDLEVNVPNPEVQKKIAEILSAYDDLIKNNLRRIALLEESARLLYKEWFVRLRFPGHEHTQIINSLSQNWRTEKLGKISEINQEMISNSFNGIIEYIDISSVTPGSINETSRYEFEDAPSRARRVVKHGDIIWSCVRPNRRSYAIIWNPPSNLIASTGFAVITPREVPTSFLYFTTSTDSFVAYLDNRTRGAAYPAVTAKDFEEAEITLPPHSLLSNFDEFVAPVLMHIDNLRIQNQKLKQARDLLLPRLMNGEITV